MVNYSSVINPCGAKRGTYLKLQPQFSEIVDYYISTMQEENKLSPASIVITANRGTMFLYYLQNSSHSSLADIAEDEVIAFFIQDGKPFRETTYRYRLSEFLQTVSEKYPECSVLKNWLPFIRKTRKNIQYLTKEEVQAIKEVLLSDSSLLSYSEKAIGLILLYTGLRGCDVASLKLENIDWDKELITLNQSKTGLNVVIPLYVHVGNAIYDYLKHERNTHADSEYLFVNSKDNKYPMPMHALHYHVDKIYDVAKIRQNKGDRRGTHLFRHHLVTTYLKNEVPQPVITSAAGHYSPASDGPYFDSDIEHLRNCALSIEDFPLNWEVFDHA